MSTTKTSSTKSALKPPTKTDVNAIVALLKKFGSKRTLEEMGPRYGVHVAPGKAFGVPVGKIQQVANKHKRNVRTESDAAWNHALADLLWKNGNYEVRMAASFIDEPELVTPAQMDRWCRDFDNWGIVDTVCFKLFDRVAPELAFRKVKQWANLKGEFQKRGGFVLLACLALHEKSLGDEVFLQCLPLIEKGALDERNFVKKGVSWALRSIGRRSAVLHAASVELAQRLAASDNSAARWTGKDALGDFVKSRFAKRR